MTETVPKTQHNRSRNKTIRGTMNLHPPRIFSHSQLHMSIDSYAFNSFITLNNRALLQVWKQAFLGIREYFHHTNRKRKQ